MERARSHRLLIAVLVALAAFAAGVIFAWPMFTQEHARVEIRGVPLVAEVAADSSSRKAGLSGRESLGENRGMLFLFEKPGKYGIWMRRMRYPLDLVWIRENRVVDIEERVPVPLQGTADADLTIYQPEADADLVLEVNAGFVAAHGITIGDEAKVFLPRRFSRAATADAGSIEPPPPLGFEYFIETLRKKPANGRDFKIGREIGRTSAYTKFGITYRSDGLTISGVMNVPAGEPPAEGFPVLILNHGLIPAEIYFSGRGSKREQDFFARNEYVVIHPDYRGLASSSPHTSAHHDFYQGYTDDVVNLPDALKRAKPSFMDVTRIGMWGHSMGGGIAARAMVISPDVKAFVLFAPISADAEENFYELSQTELKRLAETYGVGEAASGTYQKMSPLNYFADVRAPVQLHHGTADTDVPIAFSEKIYETLKDYGKKVELYRYPGEPHEFTDAWPVAADRALQFFDRYVKNAR